MEYGTGVFATSEEIAAIRSIVNAVARLSNERFDDENEKYSEVINAKARASELVSLLAETHGLPRGSYLFNLTTGEFGKLPEDVISKGTVHSITESHTFKKVDILPHKSRGTFDDFYNNEKYSSLQDAYNANDYVECNYVRDENRILHIEAYHSQTPEIKKYHRLLWQTPVAGIDALDDEMACRMAVLMLTK